MGGLVLDYFVVFAIRWLMYRWRLHKSASWPIVEATIERADTHIETYAHAVCIQFRYSVSEQLETATQRIPCFSAESAKELKKRYRIGASVKVHVDPANPNTAFLARP